MKSSFLTNTSTEGLKPLGTAPQRSFELVNDTVRAEFSEQHAALFAEPVATQYGDRFDWYATVEGRARPLSEDDQEVRETLDTLVADIKGLSDQLLASKQPDDQRLGEALGNALEIPNEASIFVVEAEGAPPQPVLVNWAWTPDEQIAVRGVLTGKDSRTPPRAKVAPVAPASAATPAAVAVAGVSALWWWLMWLGWLLLALLIAAVIYLMIEPCGLRISWLPNTCEKVEVVPDTLAEERGLLEDQIALVQKEIHIKDRLCQPDFAQLPIYDPDAVQQNLPVDPEVDQRADAAGAERGDLAFTLIWEGSDDLDLHTTCPSNETLFFLDKARCNGVMDLDMNGFQIVPSPVENTYFTAPLEGTYRVRVNLYRQRDGGARSFTLQVRDGDRVTTQKGTVSAESRNWQFSYQYRNN